MPKKPSHCSEELTDFIFLKLLTFYQKFGKDKHIAIESKVNIMSYRSKILLLDLIHILFILFILKTTGAWSYKEGCPNHNIVDNLTCYLCSHVMEVSL